MIKTSLIQYDNKVTNSAEAQHKNYKHNHVDKSFKQKCHKPAT